MADDHHCIFNYLWNKDSPFKWMFYSFSKVNNNCYELSTERTNRNKELGAMTFIIHSLIKTFCLIEQNIQTYILAGCTFLLVEYSLLGRFYSWRQLSIHYKWSLSTLNTIIKCWWASQDQVLITWVAAGPKWPRRIRGSFLFYFCIKYPD